ncbi:MAG TPA: hypothetical protein VFQ38_07075 [Longimicrobiales bacterium]|nr:hypothetical protein [Longimicrobiales bacterium]
MRLVRRWPFTTLGLLTILLLVLLSLAGAHARTSPLGQALAAAGRVLAYPMFLMARAQLAAMRALGLRPRGGFPFWLFLLSFPLRLLPYVAADVALRFVRRRG